MDNPNQLFVAGSAKVFLAHLLIVPGIVVGLICCLLLPTTSHISQWVQRTGEKGTGNKIRKRLQAFIRSVCFRLV